MEEIQKTYISPLAETTRMGNQIFQIQCTVLEYSFGVQFWSTVLEYSFGVQFWEYSFGVQFWSTVFGVQFCLKYPFDNLRRFTRPNFFNFLVIGKYRFPPKLFYNIGHRRKSFSILIPRYVTPPLHKYSLSPSSFLSSCLYFFPFVRLNLKAESIKGLDVPNQLQLDPNPRQLVHGSTTEPSAQPSLILFKIGLFRLLFHLCLSFQYSEIKFSHDRIQTATEPQPLPSCLCFLSVSVISSN